MPEIILETKLVGDIEVLIPQNENGIDTEDRIIKCKEALIDL